MSVLNTMLVVVMFVSAFLSVILILMHSGKGTGVSDMIAASLYNAVSYTHLTLPTKLEV